jgi:osmotically-inducible protein OsmY
MRSEKGDRKMPQQKFDDEIIEGSELHPEHESWARSSLHSSLIGVGVVLALGALFAITIAQHFSRGAYAALGCFAAPILLWAIWRSAPKRRKGFLDNALSTARIKAELLTELGADGVNVDSSRGVVTLRGTVPYADFREAAEQIAHRQGARKVINELTVDPASPKRPATATNGFAGVTTSEGAPEVMTQLPLAEQVRAAFDADPRMNAYVAVVRVEDGIAYLTGRQETVQASEAAAEVAAHVPGILGVVNDIEIMPSV